MAWIGLELWGLTPEPVLWTKPPERQLPCQNSVQRAHGPWGGVAAGITSVGGWRKPGKIQGVDAGDGTLSLGALRVGQVLDSAVRILLREFWGPRPEQRKPV